MAFENLPGIFSDKLDGNLSVVPANTNPVTLVIGTATKGESEALYRVDRTADAVRTFGKTGTLVRGMYEVALGGALNINLFRVGATSAKLTGVGVGLTIETIAKDDSAGTDYTIFFDDATDRLRVFRASDGEVVWDNNPAYPTETIDLSEVSVTGTISGSAGNIGTLAVPVTLAAAHGVSGASYTAGTDGTSLSRCKTYEALYNAYELLSDQTFDFVVPMNVYLDDLNTEDLTAAQISTLGLAALSDYPTAGEANDALGRVYVEEYQGENRFWWWFPSQPNVDADSCFTSDAGANIFPTGVGSASALLKTDGTALTGSDFHEVNFAYQLADFCYRQSNQNHEMVGFVGTLPPESSSLKDVSTWIGKLPVTTEDDSGNVIISTNGTGLLGNKFMSGRITSGGGAGLKGYTVAGVAGLYNGGFIATDDGWLDSTQVQDENDHYIDIGKYLSIVPVYPILSNPSITTAYRTTGAPTYAGFCSSLPPGSAPTNKVLRSVVLPYRIGTAKLDILAGQRYVFFHAKPKGVVVSDAPTAARPDSDYRRFSTVVIVKNTLNKIRSVTEPFLGESISGARLAALDTAIEQALNGSVKDQELVRYEHRIIATPAMKVLGQVKVELKLIPAFELRQITLIVGLSAT
jgi:hypothetical protein